MTLVLASVYTSEFLEQDTVLVPNSATLCQYPVFRLSATRRFYFKQDHNVWLKCRDKKNDVKGANS